MGQVSYKENILLNIFKEWQTHQFQSFIVSCRYIDVYFMGLVGWTMH